MALAPRPLAPSKAYVLVALACLSPTTTFALTEKETLTRLYRLSGGKKWSNDYGWKEAAAEFEGDSSVKPPPVCAWYGVRCLNDSGDIDIESDVGAVEINLSDNQVSGKITPHVYDMPFLETFDIRNNQIKDAGLVGLQDGDAPIKKLVLSENQLTTLEGIEFAPETLEELHINDNAFTEFPFGVFELSQLQVFMATHNDGFNANMPTEFGKMKNLRKLLLWYNKFTGKIPTELGKLKKLEQLGLDENQFTGSLPSEMGNMFNLKYFSCQNFEPTSGSITGQIPKWENLVYLKELYLDYNELTGAFPKNFLKNSNVTEKSCYFGFDQNHIEGTLPSDLSRFKKLKIDLRGNKMTEISSELCKMKKWMNGHVEQFGCDAILCPAGTRLVTGRQEQEDAPCKPCPNGDDGAPYFGSSDCSNAEGGETAPDTNGQGPDQQILVELALATNLHKWQEKTGWEDDLASVTSVDETADLALDYCKWYGVTCDSSDTKRVTELNLSKNSLKGKAPKDIYKLSALKTLDLSHNEIRMDGDKGVGQVGDAKMLEKLHLDDTAIEKLDGIGQATTLKELTLDDTFLEAPFPEEVFQLKNLKEFRAQFAGITETLPTEIGTMAALEKLNLYGNMFTGKLPAQLGQLSKLHVLDLSENEFTGSLPKELNNLSNLRQFSLHQSSRDGDGLTGALPPFDSLPNLVKFRLDSNSLEGTIPENFLAGTDKGAKVTIGLSYNQLTGVIPSSLAAFDKLNIDVVANKIIGIADDLCSKSDWNEGEVGNLGLSCDAILCPKGTYNVYGMATTKLKATCDSCPEAEFMGATYCSEEDDATYFEKNILDDLYYQTGGPQWESSKNWTEGGLGVCWYEGIKCEGGDHDNSGVTEIRLNSLGLSGDVPSSIWNLPSLRYLSLADNSVHIDFDGIEKAANLKTLNLAGAKIRSLTGILNAPNSLHELYLERNDFTGQIPSDLFKLKKLRRLKLDFNHFSGSLPTDVGQMTSLEEFWCTYNDIGGTIPTEIGLLANLKFLVLGGNHLTGFLPDELGSLTNLEYLSITDQLGDQRITGPLFDFKSNTKLTHIVLARNDISGPIPKTLLVGVDTAETVTVDLSFNQLTGEVPKELAAFDKLNINLVGNELTELPSELCAKEGWMNGKVGQLQPSCDAILCPKGFFNDIGRLEEESRPCRKCLGGESDSPYLGSNHCGASERTILMELYQFLDGDNWVQKDSWMSKNDPICKWFGVKCADGNVDGEEGVIKLILPNNGLDGEDRSALYSPLFYQLPFLQELDLKGNNVPLLFDGIGEATSLETLAISNTGLKDITGLGQAKSLKELHLTDNGLDLNFADTELFELTEIRRLFLSYNQFKGTIPAKIGRLTKLKQFWSYQNLLEGPIPTEFGLLTDLEYMIISENRLTGSIPLEVAGLTKMVDMALFNQQGEDAQLSGKLPDFSAMTQLQILDLEFNQLTGPIPDTFLSGSTVKDEYIRVALNHNQLTGVVPQSLEEFTNLSLEIVGNKIEAIPEELCDSDKHGDWMSGKVGKVGTCDAIACPISSYSDTGKQESPDTPCLPCPGSPNPYVGQDSCVESNKERDILKALFTATNGQFWVNNQNWMEDRMPICSWDRVFCGLGNSVNDHGIIKLDLESNELDGSIPSSIYELPSLQELNLKKNYDAILGFDGIENAKQLEVLYLSEIVIDSLENIGRAPSLHRLHLTGCGIFGPFPDQLFDLSSTLKELYIAYNDFTGTIPTKIGTMKKLTDFYAYDNEFSGVLPNQIADMESLKNLVLAENLISGQIPNGMGSMPTLQLFSIFRRAKEGSMLTGTLPSFADAPQLTDLYLDGNEIGGSVPNDFLVSSSQIYLVTLSNNMLTGTVSKEITTLPPFQLELEGNQFTHLSTHFCSKDDWMQGDVGKYGCDAIMCQPGYASKFGRQNSTDSQCQKCSGPDEAPYWGSTSCNGEVSPDDDDGHTKEWRILQLFYLECSGDQWRNNKNWGVEGVHVCDYYGITCTDRKTVQSIRLGANNIIGTPPSSLFDLVDLQVLWLHSNPIQFSFDNIGNAWHLVELRLDSTGLSSIDGIGAAEALEVLDLRFNKLTGVFPSEIFSLKNLQSLTLGDNFLGGQLPSSDTFAKLQLLLTLRLGVNEFIGDLPDFSGNSELVNIDLSHNFLSGTIPRSFLEKVGSNVHVNIDLAENELTGQVPVEFDRFQSMTIYLRGNMIRGLPKELCDSDNGSWNKGGVAKYGCDAIICAPGTYNPLGRQSTDDTPCLPCGDEESVYYGSTGCGVGGVRSSSSRRGFGKTCWIVRVAFLALVVAYQVVL